MGTDSTNSEEICYLGNKLIEQENKVKYVQ